MVSPLTVSRVTIIVKVLTPRQDERRIDGDGGPCRLIHMPGNMQCNKPGDRSAANRDAASLSVLVMVWWLGRRQYQAVGALAARNWSVSTREQPVIRKVGEASCPVPTLHGFAMRNVLSIPCALSTTGRY